MRVSVLDERETVPAEKAKNFSKAVPLGRPAELAPAYVYLASDGSRYVTGASSPVTRGTPTPWPRQNGEG